MKPGSLAPKATPLIKHLAMLTCLVVNAAGLAASVTQRKGGSWFFDWHGTNLSPPLSPCSLVNMLTTPVNLMVIDPHLVNSLFTTF